MALITAALPIGVTGPYQLQAAIAALHDEAPSAAATDWLQIVALYELVLQLSDNPVVALNHAVAVAMARGAPAGLALLETIQADERLAADHRLQAVRAHLLEMAGDRAGARAVYLAAARRATNLPQQRYLHTRAGPSAMGCRRSRSTAETWSISRHGCTTSASILYRSWMRPWRKNSRPTRRPGVR